MSKPKVPRNRLRPVRRTPAELRQALGTGPDALWRDGAPPTFTLAELAQKRPLVAAIERDLGRQDLITRLARMAHAVCLREARRHEAWLRQQLRTLEPPQ
jgi:hypothetical protein